MKKSQFIFLIMAVIYSVVALLDGFGWLTITENVLLGLSLSALLSALSDIFYNIGWRKVTINEFNYIIRVTVKFLSEKQADNVPISNPNINICAVRQYIKGLSKNYTNALHPAEYDKKASVVALKACSQISFILSMAAFILVPLLSLSPHGTFSTFLTLGAFSLMCLNLYMAETIADLLNRRNDDFMNKEQLIIQTAYPDFYGFLSSQLSFAEEYAPAEEAQEVKTDTRT